jgi:heterodisulfide reductase subunit A
MEHVERACFFPKGRECHLTYFLGMLPIDAKACLKLNHDSCGLCAVACQAGAIRFDDTEKTLEIPVGAVILAPGFGRVSDEVMAKYGLLGKFQDVVTAFEHERLMCASGPTGGEILRISDRKHPKKIAFLQCIGSRDETCGNNYCSSVCCMYAIKQATLAREHDPNCEITLFYMDVRTHGKGFDAARTCARPVRRKNAGAAHATRYGQTGDLVVSPHKRQKNPSLPEQ